MRSSRCPKCWGDVVDTQDLLGESALTPGHAGKPRLALGGFAAGGLEPGEFGSWKRS